MAKEQFPWGARLDFESQRKKVSPTKNNTRIFVGELDTCKDWFFSEVLTHQCLSTISNFCAVTGAGARSRGRRRHLPRWRRIAIDQIISWLLERSPYLVYEEENINWYAKRADVATICIEWAEQKRQELSPDAKGASTYYFAGVLLRELGDLYEGKIYPNYMFAEVDYADDRNRPVTEEPTEHDHWS